MINIKQDEHGINYIYDYVPISYGEKANDIISEQIVRLKKYEGEAVLRFAYDLGEALDFMCLWFPYRVALITVPTSKVSRRSPLNDCVMKLKELRESGKVKKYIFPKGGYTYLSDCIIRTEDINISHIEGRTPYNKAKASLECTISNLAAYADYFIILDDVVTSGRTLKMCKEILCSKGIRSEMIQLLALARTVSCNKF